MNLVFYSWILGISFLGGGCTEENPELDFIDSFKDVSDAIDATQTTAKVGLVRMVPEQMSNTILSNLGVRLWEGSDIDPIVDFFGVALGGVDFQSNFERDTSAKIQTLLVARSLAWMVSVKLVFDESDKVNGAQTPVVFNQALLFEDTPDNDGSGRWNEQLTEIYWRLLARPPTEAEISLHRDLFNQVLVENGVGENWPPFGWMAVFYAILASEEYWNI